MKKIIFSFIANFLFVSFSSFAQSNDLYDYQNSKLFASYLLKSGQFETASKEYERLLYFNPKNDTFKLNLMKSYRYLEKYDLGILRAKQFYEPLSAMPTPQAIEFSKLLMSKHNWDEANRFWNESKNLTETDKNLFKTSTAIFNNRFEEAAANLSLINNDSTNYLVNGYRTILNEGLYGKKKSPFLAASFSTLIPGTGKVYTGDWKDGLVAFLFTAGMAFQSYRGFSKSGIKSTRGWIYGGIGLGFYLGNIYGSAKSAKDYNKKKNNKLQHEASSLFNIYYAN